MWSKQECFHEFSLEILTSLNSCLIIFEICRLWRCQLKCTCIWGMQRKVINSNGIFDPGKNSEIGGLCPGWLSSAHFLFPVHKSFHAFYKPSPDVGLQKQFQHQNKVLFFNFQAICMRLVLFTHLVHWYLHTPLKKIGRYDLWSTVRAQFSM